MHYQHAGARQEARVILMSRFFAAILAFIAIFTIVPVNPIVNAASFEYSQATEMSYGEAETTVYKNKKAEIRACLKGNEIEFGYALPTTDLNMRAGAGDEHTVISTIPNGAAVGPKLNTAVRQAGPVPHIWTSAVRMKQQSIHWV